MLSIHEALGSVFGTTYNRCGGVCLSPACWRQRQGDHKSEVIFCSTASSRPAQVIGDPVSNKTKGRKRALPTAFEKRAVGNSDGTVAQTPSHTQCSRVGRGWIFADGLPIESGPGDGGESMTCENSLLDPHGMSAMTECQYSLPGTSPDLPRFLHLLYGYTSRCTHIYMYTVWRPGLFHSSAWHLHACGSFTSKAVDAYVCTNGG